MARLADRYPGYGWEHNAGYTTRHHVRAVGELGPTPHHRRTYQRIRAMLEGDQLDLELLPEDELRSAGELLPDDGMLPGDELVSDVQLGHTEDRLPDELLAADELDRTGDLMSDNGPRRHCDPLAVGDPVAIPVEPDDHVISISVADPQRGPQRPSKPAPSQGRLARNGSLPRCLSG